MIKYYIWNHYRHTISQAYFALHETSHEVQNFQEKQYFGTKVTSEAFLGIS